MPTRYIVHGTDQADKPVQKIFEADTAAQAEQMAGRLGMKVIGVEVDPGSAPAAVVADPHSPVIEGAGGAVRRLGPETEVWSGCPSQWVNFWWYVLCALAPLMALAILIFSLGTGWWIAAAVLAAPIPVALWKFLDVKFQKMTLTTQRLRLEEGVLSKKIDEVELYRVKDSQLKQSLIDRLLGLGTVEIVSSDETNPVLSIRSIRDARAMREHLRQCVEKLRLARGVRELDFAAATTGDL